MVTPAFFVMMMTMKASRALNFHRPVIASEARQSRVKLRNSGLLRFARNDGMVLIRGSE